MDTEIVAGLVGLSGETDPWRAVVIRCCTVDRGTVVLTDGQGNCRDSGEEGEGDEETEHLEMIEMSERRESVGTYHDEYGQWELMRIPSMGSVLCGSKCSTRYFHIGFYC
ncbi:hypothetical protein GCK72_008737 [Caenorhabditis remanei]|uniref:Uncharacterized protein n=1 Tax=Caenorhabditis remanei TaxID=31234 RepID=A0A6A5GYD3_CAERE|nr:hypothetical protein GCK72_008737 [Caenorhabditis remanei]KAF1760488.1 hypothetical protein GCK72_008737 [Caenorhabditis remanei]